MRSGRIFDILGGLLGQKTPGIPERRRVLVPRRTCSIRARYRRRGRATGSSCSRSGSAASRAARSATGRTATRCGPASPTCPTNFSSATSRCGSSVTRRVPDCGGAGLHRGGNGILMTYRFLEPREPSPSTTIAGSSSPGASTAASPARARARSSTRRTARRRSSATSSKTSMVEAGDELHFITWGGGGWGDPLDRESGAGIARNTPGAGERRRGAAPMVSWPTAKA